MRVAVKRLLSAVLFYTGLLHLLIRLCPPAGVILCAHRITRCQDPFFPGIQHHHFTAHVRYLARYWRIVPLEDMVEALRNGQSLPPRTVALTFDDGFIELYTLAYPTLRRYGVPATVFLIAGAVHAGRLPWPERVVDLIRRTTMSEVSVPSLGPDEFPLRTESERLASLREILRLLKQAPTRERERAVNQLEDKLRVPRDQGEMLTWDQVCEMAQGGVRFEAHTLTHPILPVTDLDDIKREVSESKIKIEEEIGQRVRFFAYPNGAHSSVVVEVVRDAGFEAAFGTVPVDGVDLFRIGRSDYDDVPLSVFAAQLAGVWRGLHRLRRNRHA